MKNLVVKNTLQDFTDAKQKLLSIFFFFLEII